MVDKDAKKLALAKHLAPLIKQAIKESERNQDEIAEEIGISKAAVSKWGRTGGIELHHLYSLAVATKKSPGWFFPGYKEPNKSHESTSLARLLSEHSGDTEFLEDTLLTVLIAKQRASNSS